MAELSDFCNEQMAPPGAGMAETSGTSAMNLYNSNTSAGLGMEMAGKLSDYEMMQRQKMAPPAGGETMDRPFGAPEWYNYKGMAPAKYAVPTDYKDRMVAKAAIRNAAAEVGSSAVPRPDPIGEDEVNYLQAMQKQSELADFDRYINTLIDVRKPGNLKWLMEVYPEFVHRRVAQVHDDYDFAIRKQMIKNWGVNTFDDLHFLYLMDQKKIDGPELGKRVAKDLNYKAGYLSPLAFHQKRPNGVRLPFSSTDNKENWVQSDSGQPLAGGRDINTMARSVMNLNPDSMGAEGDGSGGIIGTVR
jgi:hypothetical protein